MNDNSLYDNTAATANIVSVVSAVLQKVSGNKIADMSSVEDKSALANFVAVKLQTRLTPLIVGGVK
ncbi:hypothetical protein [Proteus phage 10]|uniref:hypothetical protein n=1 Tax=Proteus TaxID=583 RepID=UPI0015F2414E|nr:hypothetical protein [Proteus columbae]QMP24097.1 hypothetical protein [Proteus phage 10]